MTRGWRKFTYLKDPKSLGDKMEDTQIAWLIVKPTVADRLATQTCKVIEIVNGWLAAIPK